MSEPADRPRPVLSPLFWTAMVCCLLCFGAAAYVMYAATHLEPRRPAALGLHPRPR